MSATRYVSEALSGQGVPAPLSGFVAGEWVSSNGTLLDVVDPATGDVMVQLVESSADLVDQAVREAQEAWTSTWRWADPTARGRALMAVAERLRENAGILAALESADSGKPLSQARADVEVAARYFEYYGGAADKFGGDTIPQPHDTFSYTVREPLGVVAHITPWNAPLSQMMRGVAPCLAAGNTVVVKPSEMTPITSLLAARLAFDAGLPAGVCNVLPGSGRGTGESLARHPLVRHITFTGSVSTGRHVGQIAADRIIGCTLELGGKSAAIVMADADLDRAARAGANAVVRNSGQSCFAATRLLVDRRVAAPFIEKVKGHMGSLTVGSGLDDPDLGPLISEPQRQRVHDLVASAQQQGAEVWTSQLAGGLPEAGYFVAPTLLTQMDNSMTAAREEIFGPVQSVLVFDDLDEAIEIANDSPYGLSAGIFTSSISVAHHAAARLDAGQVQVNRYTGAGVEVPFGGYKNSGLGREKGREALLHYTQLKSVIVAI